MFNYWRDVGFLRTSTNIKDWGYGVVDYSYEIYFNSKAAAGAYLYSTHEFDSSMDIIAESIAGVAIEHLATFARVPGIGLVFGIEAIGKEAANAEYVKTIQENYKAVPDGRVKMSVRWVDPGPRAHGFTYIGPAITFSNW
jgi:hypothetical protein